MKLGNKLMISYAGVVLLAVSIVLVLVIDSSLTTYKNRIGSDLQHISELIAEDIRNYFNSIKADLKIYSRSEILGKDNKEDINSFLSDILNRDYVFRALSLAGSDGTIIASTSPVEIGRSILPGSENATDIIKKTLNRKEGYVLFADDLVPGSDGQLRELKVQILMQVPLDGQGKPDRILSGIVNIYQVVETFCSMEDQAIGGEAAYLVNDPGEIILTRDEDVKIFAPLTYIQPGPDFLREEPEIGSGHTSYIDESGDRELAGYSRLITYGVDPDRNWTVVSVAKQKDIFGPAVELRNKIMVLGVVAILIAGGIGMIIARGITGPVLKLVSVTKLIARGDLSQRAGIKQKDEVGDLARSFNNMTDQLSAAIITRDKEIDERKKIEQRLREEMDAKSKFISMISYEFKTPLTAIKQAIGMIMREAAGTLDGKHKELLALAEKSADNLTTLLRDIVDFHRLETDIAAFDIKENNINEVVQDVKRVAEPLLEGKEGVRFIINTDDTLPGMKFDQEKIMQVLSNVVRIAIAFTEKGSITVTTAREGANAVKVSVEDTGSEIKEEDLPRLFHQYEHPGKRRDKEAGGTGLGLAISREIIEKHGGKIWAEAKEPTGTAFYFVLPIVERRKRVV